jgi:hypothetical protein
MDAVWDELTYSEARMLKDKDASDLAPQMSAQIERLENVRTGQYAAWRAEIVAQAGVDAADDGLDDTVDEISKELLSAAGGDRKSPRYARYFSTPPSLVIRLRLESEIKRVEGWPASLATEPEKGLNALGATLGADIGTGKEALQQRVDAAAARADHRVREIVALVDEVNAVRLSVYGILVQRVGPRKLARDWPNRFFKRTQRVAKTVEPPGGGTPG